MSPDKMIRMANQIAGFYDTQRHGDAPRETAAHLKSFWEPRMLAALQAHLDSGGQGLCATALAAAQSLSTARA
jgi:formate dehydrogenase subunit delta